MAQWKATFRDRSGKATTMVVEDATLKGANETAKYFEASRGRVVKVEAAK